MSDTTIPPEEEVVETMATISSISKDPVATQAMFENLAAAQAELEHDEEVTEEDAEAWRNFILYRMIRTCGRGVRRAITFLRNNTFVRYTCLAIFAGAIGFFTSYGLGILLAHLYTMSRILYWSIVAQFIGAALLCVVAFFSRLFIHGIPGSSGEPTSGTVLATPGYA